MSGLKLSSLGLLGSVGAGSSVIYPLDAFSGPAPIAAYSDYALRSGVGDAFTLVRNDSAVQTFAADAIDDAVAWIGAGYARRSDWKDQEGNGHHITQTTPGNRPMFLISPRDGRSVAEFHFAARAGAAANGFKWFTQPSSLAINGRNVTTVTVYLGSAATSTIDRTFSGQTPHFNWSNGSAYHGVYGAQTSQDYRGIAYNNSAGQNSDVSLRPNDVGFQVFGWRSNETNQTMWLDGIKTSFGTAGQNATYTNTFGSSFGKLNSIYMDGCDVLAHIIFPKLTDEQFSEIGSLLRSYFGFTLPTAQVIMDGTSIDAGYEATQARDWRDHSPLFRAQALMSAQFKGCVVAVAGSTLATAGGSGQLNSEAANKVDLLFNATVFPDAQICIIGSPTNDVHYGETGAGALAKLETYIAGRKATGFTVYSCDMPPRQTFNSTQNAHRDTFNSLHSAASGGVWTGVGKIPLAALNWQPGGSSDWSTEFQDGVHPKLTSMLMPNAIKAAIEPLL